MGYHCAESNVAPNTSQQASHPVPYIHTYRWRWGEHRFAVIPSHKTCYWMSNTISESHICIYVRIAGATYHQHRNDAMRHHFALYHYLEVREESSGIARWTNCTALYLRAPAALPMCRTGGKVSAVALRQLSECAQRDLSWTVYTIKHVYRKINKSREIKRRRDWAWFQIYVGWHSRLEVVNNTEGASLYYLSLSLCGQTVVGRRWCCSRSVGT